MMSEKSQRTANLKMLHLAGVCGILGSTLPLVMVLSATFLSSWFSWSTNALSEMGVGEQAALFNSAVLIGGALNFLYALGLRHNLGGGKLTQVGVVSIMVSSISLALVGIFTVDYLFFHGIVAFGYFMLTPVGFLLIGLGTKEEKIKKLSFSCGIAALFAILVLPVLILALSLGIGFAVPELVEGLVISVWTLLMSARLLAANRVIA